MSDLLKNVSQYPVRIREPVPPQETAQMPFKVQRGGRIVDVVGLPSNVVVVQAALGRTRFNREEMKYTLAEHLDLQHYEAKAGAYCVFTVLNLGAKAVEVTGKVLVEGEASSTAVPASEGAKAEQPRVVEAMPRRRNPENDARVEAIIDGAEMGSAVGASSKRPRSSTRSSSKGRAVGGTPLTRAMRSQKILTQKERHERYKAEAAIASANAPPSGTTLAESDRFVTLHAAHVEILDLMLTARVPLDDAARAEINAAFWNATGHSAIEPRRGEVVLRLSTVDFDRLAEAIEMRAESTLEDADDIANAIRHALAGTTSTEGVKAKALDESVEADAVAESASDAPPGTGFAAPEPERPDLSKVTPITGKIVQDDGRHDAHRPGAPHLKSSAANEA